MKTKLTEELKALTDEETAVEQVKEKITNLGASTNVAIEEILAARSAYNALSTTAKKRVTNIKVLTDLEKSYKSVVNVISLFEKLDSTSKSYISKAKSAYTAYSKLDNANQAFALNYKGLNKNYLL